MKCFRCDSWPCSCGTTLLLGDCLEVMRELPAASVNCCVTSPPYWGLRDYGTAVWQGGEADCEHEASERTYAGITAATSSADAFIGPGAANVKRLKKGRWRESGDCTKCGAVKVDFQIGLERTPLEFVSKLVAVFDEVRRVLRNDGTLWLNLGDTYAQGNKGNSGELEFSSKQATNIGSHATRRGVNIAPNRTGGTNGFCKAKDLCGIPWMVAFALRDAGWWLRQDIIWNKPNAMPEPVEDRCTKAHEYIFLFAKSARYYYNHEAISEPAKYAGDSVSIGEKSLSRGQAIGAGVDPSGNANKEAVIVADDRNKRSVWTVTTKPYKAAHFATFPPDLIQPCILAGCPEGGTVLDPFLGSGTTALVAQRNGCKCIGIELNPEYMKLARNRIRQTLLV